MTTVQLQVLSVRPFSGVSKAGKPYAFSIVEGFVLLDGQNRVCELMVEKLDGVSAGALVEVTFRPSIGQDKRLAMRVDSVVPAKRPVGTQAAGAGPSAPVGADRRPASAVG